MRLEPFATLTFGPSDRQKTAASFFAVRAVGSNPLAGPQTEVYPGKPTVAAFPETEQTVEQSFGDGTAEGGLAGKFTYSLRAARRRDGVAAWTLTGLVTLTSGGHATIRAHGRELTGARLVLLAEVESGGPLASLLGDAFVGEGNLDAASGRWTVALSRALPAS
ncbi:MAG: hypothetical protein ACKVVT_13225 [Dehalococcoidia bacterium]